MNYFTRVQYYQNRERMVELSQDRKKRTQRLFYRVIVQDRSIAGVQGSLVRSDREYRESEYAEACRAFRREVQAEINLALLKAQEVST